MRGDADDNGGEEQCEENLVLPTETPIMTSIMRVEMRETSSTTRETHLYAFIGLSTQLTRVCPRHTAEFSSRYYPLWISNLQEWSRILSTKKPTESVDQSTTT